MKNEEIKQVISTHVSKKFNWLHVDRDLEQEEQDLINIILKILSFHSWRNIIHEKILVGGRGWINLTIYDTQYYVPYRKFIFYGKLKKINLVLEYEDPRIWLKCGNWDFSSFRNEGFACRIPIDEVKEVDLFEILLNNFRFRSAAEIKNLTAKLENILLKYI